VEAYDSLARFAARARYSVTTELPDGLLVSDLLICRPFAGGRMPVHRGDPVLQPLTSLATAAGTTLGVYAEVYRLAGTGAESLRVEFSLEPADSPGLLAQFGRWLGRAARLTQPQADPRVAWSAEVENAVHRIAVNLPLDPGRTGRHVLILRVTDAAKGVTAEARRILLLRDE
jgi:hypothetical protein